MPIPTEVVGSLPRPQYLQKAYADYDAGVITRDELVRAQDRAAEDSVTQMSQTGETLVTDGEQRASSFATYPIIDTLGGKGLADNLAADGQYFAIFDDGHHRQLPRLKSGPLRYKTYAYENFKKSYPYAKGHGMKQAVIAPSMLYLLYPLNGTVEGYPKETFVGDLVNECEKDIRGCFEAGAKRVSIDFTEGKSASPFTSTHKDSKKKNPQLTAPFKAASRPKTTPATRGPAPPSSKPSSTSTTASYPASPPPERANIGIHTCPGGDCDSVHSHEVPYAKLLPSLFAMNAGYFLIQLASEKDKRAVYEQIGRSIRRDAEGVKQVAFVGVTDPLNPEVESKEQVAAALEEASRWIEKDQLGATDDCGFSPFSIDVKPKHGSPDFAREVAMKKIRARVVGARMASERLGI